MAIVWKSQQSIKNVNGFNTGVSLFQEEQAVLDKIVRETQRRASLVPPAAGNPSILVSEPSVGDFDDPFFFGNPRRSSTQSMGPVVVPVSGGVVLMLMILFKSVSIANILHLVCVPFHPNI